MSLLSKLKTIDFQYEKVGSTAVPLMIFDKLQKIRKLAVKSVCKIKTTGGEQGTGALYQAVDQNLRNRFFIMTCNHVLPTTSLREITQTIFEFEEIQQMSSILLRKTDVKFAWTSKQFDATVIELSPEVKDLYSSFGAQFLIIGDVKIHVEVALLQYPLGTLSIAHGDIEGLSDTDVFYRIGTAPGSSGSPLLTWNCVALAMHSAGSEGAMGIVKSNSIRKASALNAVVKLYLEESFLNFSTQEIRAPKEQQSLRHSH